MKNFVVVLMVFILVVAAANTEAQVQRNPQFEVYAGLGIPLGPEGFKEFYKMGISLNAQYVFFPTPTLGIPIFVGYEHFTVDQEPMGEAFGEMMRFMLMSEGIGLADYDIDVEGSGRTIKFGVGVRPYLTPVEAPTQIFLFGNATFNLLTTKLKFNRGTFTVYDLGNPYITEDITLTDSDLGDDAEVKDDESKFGLGGGAGIEIPAGESFNIILQGLFNIIFTDEESLTFLGVTAGLVF